MGSIGVDGRSADGPQSPHRSSMALCGSCNVRDGEIIRSRGLSRTGVVRVCGDLRLSSGWVSYRLAVSLGVEWLAAGPWRDVDCPPMANRPEDAG